MRSKFRYTISFLLATTKFKSRLKLFIHFALPLCSSDVRISEIRIEEMDELRIDQISSSNHHHTQHKKSIFALWKQPKYIMTNRKNEKRHAFRFLKGNFSWSHLWREARRQMKFVGNRKRKEVRRKKILACKDSSYTSTSVNHAANINTLRPASESNESSGGSWTSGIAAAGAGSWKVVISTAFLFIGLLLFHWLRSLSITFPCITISSSW